MSAKIALCAAHPLPDTDLPERLTVLPAGEVVRGRDGRAWNLKDQAAVLAKLKRPIQLDENHSAVHKAPIGEPSPAAGWLRDFKFEDGALTAAVEWTPMGKDLLGRKAYRYLSPALLHDPKGATKDTLGTIVGLHSVGLTNDPNLDLPALNSTEVGHTVKPEQLKALGLQPDATDEQVAARIAELSKPQPDVSKLVADAVAAVFAAQKPAPEKSEELQAAANSVAEAHKIAVNAVIDGAVVAGKVAPGAKDALASMAKDAAGLASLQAYVAALPVVAPNGKDKVAPPQDAPKVSKDVARIRAVFGLKDGDK